MAVDKGLKPIQLKAIHLLLEKGEKAGAVRETAEEIGLSRLETICRWRKNPLFAQEYKRQKAIYEATLSDEPLASRRRRIQLLEDEIAAIKKRRDETEGITPKEFAAASRVIGMHTKQIAEEMAPFEDLVTPAFAEPGADIREKIEGMTTEELKAAQEILTDPKLEALAPLVMAVLHDTTLARAVEQAPE